MSTCVGTRSSSRRSWTISRRASTSLSGAHGREKEEHDPALCSEGSSTMPFSDPGRQKRGFRVTTNTTVFEGVDSKEVQFFGETTELGVEGMMISPGYSLTHKASDQQHSHRREAQPNQHVPQAAPLPTGTLRWRFTHVAAVPGIPGWASANICYCTPWGQRLPTASSGGRSPATCCRTGTPRASASSSTRRAGRTTARRAATRPARTAWCTAVSRRARSRPRSRRRKGMLAMLRAMFRGP